LKISRKIGIFEWADEKGKSKLKCFSNIDPFTIFGKIIKIMEFKIGGNFNIK
jgi:hypothetical protein